VRIEVVHCKVDLFFPIGLRRSSNIFGGFWTREGKRLRSTLVRVKICNATSMSSTAPVMPGTRIYRIECPDWPQKLMEQNIMLDLRRSSCSGPNRMGSADV